MLFVSIVSIVCIVSIVYILSILSKVYKHCTINPCGKQSYSRPLVGFANECRKGLHLRWRHSSSRSSPSSLQCTPSPSMYWDRCKRICWERTSYRVHQRALPFLVPAISSSLHRSSPRRSPLLSRQREHLSVAISSRSLGKIVTSVRVHPVAIPVATQEPGCLALSH